MLLFKGNGFSRAVVRTITGGNFDHCAVVFKNKGEDRKHVTFIESVQDKGVTSNSWEGIRSKIGPNEFFN